MLFYLFSGEPEKHARSSRVARGVPVGHYLNGKKFGNPKSQILIITALTVL